MDKIIIPIVTVAKVVSGGQTGVDRGALEAALTAGFPYGGLVPKGRLAEDGVVPARFTNMTEAESENYRFRTRWNVEHADATLILSFSEELEGGTQRTRQYCMNVRKPYFVDNPRDPKMEGGRLAVFAWLETVCRKNNRRPLVLNVAGPRESKAAGISSAAEKYVARIIADQMRAQEMKIGMKLCDAKVDFAPWFVTELAMKGIDVAVRVTARLSAADGVMVERLSDACLMLHDVPSTHFLDVRQCIQQVVRELGWTEEPSHVVVVACVRDAAVAVCGQEGADLHNSQEDFQ
ncbi:MAG: putative molybdenum carrier protein [bacterium]|nr:putative molybdenum carrier protein [bacterium]